MARTSLQTLAAEEEACQRCPLYRDATQAVPGEGAASADLMLVGEQPGDLEDIEGKPFVGPAGRVLDHALDEAGIKRAKTFVTNAVKHFKFEPRGKKRLHKRPNAYEIERCKWWLDKELAVVKPKLILALGATAARSITGKPVRISSIRGEVVADGTNALMVTVHPSSLLRAHRDDRYAEHYALFLKDLKSANRFLASH